MALTAFSPPGGVDDLSDAGKQAWSSGVSDLLDAAAIGEPDVPNDSPRPQFFNPLGVELAADATPKVMSWGAFPRKLANQPAPRRWELAEERQRQEEYCEWSAERDSERRLLRAFFTSEAPEYFHRLATEDPKRLEAVYQAHVSEEATESDLIVNGSYREDNQWNQRGAMHMIQQFNTLTAAVTLTAQASIVRSGAQGLLTNANDLIRCGVIADIKRNSDPLIVTDVNALARADAGITLEDPLGLYIEGLRTPGWVTPDGADPAEFWQVTRGDEDHALRAVFAVPPERDYAISDITIDGRLISSPSQIAEFVQVKVVGLAHGFGQHAQEPRHCADAPGRLEARGGVEARPSTAISPAGIAQFIGADRRSR